MTSRITRDPAVGFVVRAMRPVSPLARLAPSSGGVLIHFSQGVHLLTLVGGAAGIRTPDLRRARAALSRLSYGPPLPAWETGGRAWTRTRDLGLIRAAL